MLRPRNFIFLILFLIFGWLFITYLVLKPANDRNWEVGMDILPDFEINGNQIKIQNFRDFRFDNGKNVSMDYVNRQVDVTKITQVWFIQEPFTIKPFTNFGGVAHTYFVFDLSDQQPIVVSVEARREKGEKFDAWLGLINRFELIYIWGTEKDETVRRIIVENNKLYMYPLQGTQFEAQQLFLQLAQTSHDLETTPRFYNTLTSNCTNELAKAANKIKPNAIPFNRALFFPGYSDIELYKLGYLPNKIPFDQLKQKSEISEAVRKYYNQPDFSKMLRDSLQ